MAGEIAFAQFQPQDSIGNQFVKGMDAAGVQRKNDLLLSSQLRQAENSNALSQYQLSSAKRADADAAALRVALSTPGFDPVGNPAHRRALMAIPGGVDILSKIGVADKSILERDKLRQEIIDKALTRSKSLLDTEVQTPEQAMAWHRANHSDPILGPLLKAMNRNPGDADNEILAASASPEAFAQWKYKSSKGTAAFMEHNKPSIHMQDTGTTSQALSIPGLGGAATVVPGSTATKAMTPYETNMLPIHRQQLGVAQGNLAIAGARLADETGMNLGGAPTAPAPVNTLTPPAPVANTLTVRPPARAAATPAPAASGLSPRDVRAINTADVNEQIKAVNKTKAEEEPKFVSGLTAIDEARKSLKDGMFTGSLSNINLAVSKLVPEVLTPDALAAKITNTEKYKGATGQLVLNIIKMLGSGTGISDEDRRFVAKIVGAETTLEPKSISELLRIGEDHIRNTTRAHNRTATALEKKGFTAGAGKTIKLPPATIASDSDFTKLDSGEEFVAPDGTIRRKP